jgi:hypothetical protein
MCVCMCMCMCVYVYVCVCVYVCVEGVEGMGGRYMEGMEGMGDTVSPPNFSRMVSIVEGTSTSPTTNNMTLSGL